MRLTLLARQPWVFRLSALLFALGTAFSALLTFLAASMPMTIGATIEHSQQILRSFQAADKAIATYRQHTGKLELPRSRDEAETGSYPVRIIDPAFNDYNTCCQEALAALGTPPPGSYLLQVWRGEWSEYYAPWSGKSTLTFDPDDYSATGSLYLDAVLAAIITGALAYGTVRLWKASRTTTRG